MLGSLTAPAAGATAAGDVAFSLVDGEAVRGQLSVYAGSGTGLQLSIDGTSVTASPEPSLPATVSFEADGIQSGSQRLLNSLWVNGQMVTLIQQDYSGFATATVAIPAGMLHPGTNQVTVRAGSSVSPTDLTKNHDDFTIRDVRLRTLGGDDIRDPAIPPDQAIFLGDGFPGGNATEEQVTKTFAMDVSADELAGVSYAFDSRQLADGAHTLSATAPDGSSGAITFRVDNTPPAIVSTSPADGGQIDSGNVSVDVDATDAVSGLAPATAVLDGRTIPVPDSFPVENIPAGGHRMDLTVADNAGNTDTRTVRFTTSEVPIPKDAYYLGQLYDGPVAGAHAPVLAAAGDVACAATSKTTRTACHQAGTANLVASWKPDAVAMLGDGQYDVGTLDAFNASYDKSWGGFKNLTHPIVGNHEYAQAYYPGAQADGYFDYFNGAHQETGPAGDRQRGYYSYDLGLWHIVTLNSECGVVSCAPGGGQYRWLDQDLRRHHTTCTLLAWHKPIYSALVTNGIENPDPTPLWQLARRHGVDIVLNGHDHNYQRYAPLDGAGEPDPHGIREFVIGTGGVGFHPNLLPVPHLAVDNADTFGALKLALHPTGYTWAFVPEPGDNGSFTDAGTGTCSTTPPGQPH